MGLTRYPFFKVGLSYKPTNRWTYFPDYKSAQKMVVAYCTDNPDQMGRMVLLMQCQAMALSLLP